MYMQKVSTIAIPSFSESLNTFKIRDKDTDYQGKFVIFASIFMIVYDVIGIKKWFYRSR